MMVWGPAPGRVGQMKAQAVKAGQRCQQRCVGDGGEGARVERLVGERDGAVERAAGRGELEAGAGRVGVGAADSDDAGVGGAEGFGGEVEGDRFAGGYDQRPGVAENGGGIDHQVGHWSESS